MSQITDQMVERHAESLAKVTVLDISYCLQITSKGLEAFGKQCKSLVHLKRNMPPPEWWVPPEAVAHNTDDSEALTIADTMAGLNCLELCFGHFGDRGLNAIFTKCKSLAHLNIQGCWNVDLEGDLKEKCEKLVAFTDPWLEEYENTVESSGSDSSEEESPLESE